MLQANPTSTESDSGWLSRERAMALALIAITVIVFYLCYLLALPFLPALAWGLALAIVAYPVHRRIERVLGRPSIAAGISVALVGAVLILPCFFVAQRLITEAISRVEAVQEYLSEDRWQETLAAHPNLASAVDWLNVNVDISQEFQATAKNVASKLPGYLNGSLWTVAQLLITLLVVFYFLRDRHVVLQSLRRMTPLSNPEADRMFDRVDDTIHASVFGSLMVALIQGTMGGLIFWMLGLPTPLLWGSVMALLAIVPMLGTFVVWLPTAVFLILQGHYVKAMILVAWGSIAIGLIDNLLYPVLVGKRMRMHPLLIFIAVVGGLGLFGAAGIVLGPVVVAVTSGILDVWRQRTAFGGAADAPAQ